MEGKHELTATYVALLDQVPSPFIQVRALLSRDSLCNNTYLFKQMKHSLTIPLYIFAEERRIAAITSDDQQIAQVLSPPCRPFKSLDWLESPTIEKSLSSSTLLSRSPPKHQRFSTSWSGC